MRVMPPNNHPTALLQSDIVGLTDYETVQVFVNAILARPGVTVQNLTRRVKKPIVLHLGWWP
jgi:hypothetical protein